MDTMLTATEQIPTLDPDGAIKAELTGDVVQDRTMGDQRYVSRRRTPACKLLVLLDPGLCLILENHTTLKVSEDVFVIKPAGNVEIKSQIFE